MASGIEKEVDKDSVQIFSVAEALKDKDRGRIDMATSRNSYIAVFNTRPRGGEPNIHQHPDSDQILYILEGECIVTGASGKARVGPNEGILIPAGVNYAFTNPGDEDLVFLSMRTEAVGGRRAAYIGFEPSDIEVRVPLDAIGSGPEGLLWLYPMNRSTIALSSKYHEPFNKASILSMRCPYETRGDAVVAILPERLAQWYGLNDLHDDDYIVLPDPSNTRVRIDLSPIIRRQMAAN
ncbi:MAG: Cupin protein [Chloroflexi bacterium]|nr:Cupin protein [Chloroflexota bacterium]